MVTVSYINNKSHLAPKKCSDICPRSVHFSESVQGHVTLLDQLRANERENTWWIITIT